MFRNFLRAAVRNLFRNKVSSFINITGLAIGMCVATLIGLYIWDELTFDFYHKNHSRIAQVMDTETINGEKVTTDINAIPLADELRRNYASDIEQVAVVFPNFTHTVAFEGKKLSQSGQWVQSGFPEMLSLHMVAGSRTALKDASAVLLSRSLSHALFGEADPMNKTLRLDNMTEVRVGGVYEDLPLNSSFQDTKLFLSWDKAITVMSWLKKAQTQWDNRAMRIYIQINDHVDMAAINNKIRDVVSQYVNGRKEEILLFPMNKWHLYKEFKNGQISGGRIRYVWMFGTIGIFVLFLACINFMNLSTARSEKRAKEIGIRKTIGSLRSQLIAQFLGESLLFAIFALIVAVIFSAIALPFFNQLTGKSIFIPLSNPVFLATIVSFALFTGLIAGSYPAFYLSGFDPIKALKGKIKAGPNESIPRKALVVLQFSVSISIMIGTVVVYKQIQFAKNRPVGYTRSGLLSITMNTPEIYDAPYNALRNELIQSGVVADMAKSSTPSTESPENNTDITWRGKDPAVAPVWGEVVVTHDFGNTVDWKMIDGRNFSRTFPTDSGSYILNEAAVKVIGFSHPIGELMYAGGKSHLVIGVVKDLVMESPYQPVKPTIFSLGFAVDFYNALTIRVKPEIAMGVALSVIEKIFKKYNPNGSFEYKFIDEEYARKFSDEIRIGHLSTCFSILAIFISCLGLFGLASFVAEQRIKEIGIRKVLGASVFSLWTLQSKEFFVLIVLAFVISAPLSYLFMNNWLQNYQYRTELNTGIFMYTIIGTLTITFLTVSYQAIRAAKTNPIYSLKND